MKALTHRGIRRGIDPVEPAPLHTDAARDDSVPLGRAERAQLGTAASTWPNKQPGWQSHNRAPRKGRARPTRTLQLANTQVIEFSRVENRGGSGCAANSRRGSFLKLNGSIQCRGGIVQSRPRFTPGVLKIRGTFLGGPYHKG